MPTLPGDPEAQLEGEKRDVIEIRDAEPDSIDIEPLKIGCSPCKPSAQEVEDHRISHYPFRNWCKFCVACKALGERRDGGSQEHSIPIVGIDYFYHTAGGVQMRRELQLDDAALATE